ncbi:hypothetical protein [Thiococcus pfennigii]|uniref:hypothetical protein n=1 Tax=Thiococcus pfennigii TaxID=1057 RepID=UPI001903A972|nr:hypothetical protein [Thiococcus pfennigii]
MPAGVARARRQARRKLAAWLRREVIRAVAKAAEVTQKALKTLVRFVVSQGEDGIRIWIGTNPIKAHHLGTVRWTRRMRGARVGRRLFPGSWSWGVGSRTQSAVMERTGDTRLPIAPVTVEVHDKIMAAIDALLPDVAQRFEYEMERALRDQLFRENRTA